MAAALQVQHLRILGRLHVKRGHYREAAQTLQLLGLRKSGHGPEAVTLADRQEALFQAVLQVCLTWHPCRVHPLCNAPMQWC